MQLLYVINIALAVALLFWPIWFSKYQLRLSTINPLTITMAIGLPIQLFKLFGGPLVLIEAGLFDTGYQFALLMTNIQVALQTLALVVFYVTCKRNRIERYLPFQKVRLRPRDIKRAEYAFLGLFALTFYLLATGDFGLLNWIGNPREGYQLHRTGQGHWYALATSFLSAAFLLSFLAKPNAKSILFNTIIYIAFSYLLGSKGIMFTIFGAALTFLWFIRWPHLDKAFWIGTPLIFLLLVVSLYLTLSDGFGFQTILEYFDYFKNASDYYNAYLSGQLGLFHGDVILTNVWSYVPRGFWPDKPLVYGISLVNEIFFPGQAELTNTPAFGGAVEQFADFGVFGVVIFSLFSVQSLVTACLSYLVFRRPGIRLSEITMATVFLMLVDFAPMFGSFFPGGLYLLLVIFVVALVRGLRVKRRRRANPERRPQIMPGAQSIQTKLVN